MIEFYIFRGDLDDVLTKTKFDDWQMEGRVRDSYWCAVWKFSKQSWNAFEGWTLNHVSILKPYLQTVSMGENLRGYLSKKSASAGPLIIELPLVGKWVSTTALEALDDPLVVKTKIWKDLWVPVGNTYCL